jgi:hypothetical protein
MKNYNNHSNTLVSVATFDRRPDARALKSLLESEGIEATVQDETRLQRFWFSAEPKAGIHVQVPRESFERTEKLLTTGGAFEVLCAKRSSALRAVRQKCNIPRSHGKIFCPPWPCWSRSFWESENTVITAKTVILPGRGCLGPNPNSMLTTERRFYRHPNIFNPHTR